MSKQIKFVVYNRKTGKKDNKQDNTLQEAINEACRKNNKINTLSLNNYENKYISLVLEVNRIKEIMTKNNDVMAFLKASDEYTQIDLTLFPNIYTKDLSLDINDIIDITGKVEKRFNNYQIVVSKITNLTKESKKWRSIFYLSLHYY